MHSIKTWKRWPSFVKLQCMCILAIRIKRQQETDSVAKDLFTWAGLTGLDLFPRSRLTSKSFVRFSMCSYERVGWLGSRDLSFSNRDLGKQATRKSKFLYFAMFSSFLEFRARTCPQDLSLFSSRKPGWNFSYEPKAKRWNQRGFRLM